MAEKKGSASPATPAVRSDEELLALTPEQIRKVSDEELSRLEVLESEKGKPPVNQELPLETEPPAKKSRIEIVAPVKAKEKLEVVPIDELFKKKGWTKDEGVEKLNQSYQNLEKFIETKSKDTELTKKQMKELELELAKMKGMIEQAGKTPIVSKTGDNQEEQLALRERMAQLLSETPEMFAQAIIDETNKKVEKTVAERLKAMEEKRATEQQSVEAAEEEFNQILEMLPGVTKEEKESEFEKIKPLLNEYMEKRPYLTTAPDGVTVALRALIGEGKIKILDDNANLNTEEEKLAQDKLNLQKKSIPRSPGQGGVYKAGLTLDEFNKLPKEERDKIPQEDLDRLWLEENRERLKPRA